MRRLAATVVLAMTVVSVMLPVQLAFSQSSDDGRDARLVAPSALMDAVGFPVPFDTSYSLPEYPLVSRALMLQGGSTDVLLDDLDGDGLEDLAVAVSDANLLSVFLGQPSGTYLSWPSVNVSLTGTPLALDVVDRYGNGIKEVVVLVMKSAGFTLDNCVRVNTTTWLQSTPSTVSDGAMAVVVANLTGAFYPDIAIISQGSDPEASNGYLEVFRGPNFVDSVLIDAGLGASSIACDDFDDDGALDIAVSNKYDETVEIFLSPLTTGMPPSKTLSVDGVPYALTSGAFNGDFRMDLAVVCQSTPSLQFFYQGDAGLPTSPNPKIALPLPPSRVVDGDMNMDGRTDVLVMSEAACRFLGFLQGTSVLWSSTPSFAFPCGAVPRGAAIGDVTGDDVVDIALATAREDWSGSSIAIYPGGAFSNADATVWADQYEGASMIAAGDLDGDGIEDLVLSYPHLNAFGFMLGFTGDINMRNIGFNPESLLVADLDGDGHSDVITCNGTHDYAWVHFGADDLPSGSMSPVQLPCQGNLTDVAVGDLNGDNLLDVVASTSNGTVELFFNSGSLPVFGEPLVLEVSWGVPVESIAVGDFDSDGLDDIAYPRSPRYVDIVVQDAEVPMALPADITLAATSGPLAQLWTCEVNGDFRDDLAVLTTSGATLYLFEQGSFESGVEYDSADFPEAPSHISVMDVTEDEVSDLLVAFPSADLLFMYMVSGPSSLLSPSMTFVTGALPACVAFGDATGDLVNDLLVLDSLSNAVSVWVPVVIDVGPTAMLNLSTPGPEEGVPFSFVDESVGYDPIVAWEWTLSYPDGTNDTWDLDGDAMADEMFSLGDGEYVMSLQVTEPDGDSDQHSLSFSVLETPPSVSLSLSPAGGRYLEFETITFLAEAGGYDPVTSYEWQFDASGDEFVADEETDVGETTYAYLWTGDFTVKVKVTDSDGSSTVQSVDLQILDAELSGSFEDVVVTRDPEATYIMTFDADALALINPEISSVTWEFGDGETLVLPGPPSGPVTHSYEPTRNYVVNLTIADDDGNQLRLVRTLPLVEPTVTLISPANGSVVASGTAITFTVGDDSAPLESVRYSVNGGDLMDLEMLYSIGTSGWDDGTYTIDVVAEDRDGNVARRTLVTVVVDDTSPSLVISWQGEAVYGGDRVNISVTVEDANGLLGAVVLHVRMPGDDSAAQLQMQPAGNGLYYAHVEVPKREGSMEFFVSAQDLAGNSAASATYSVEVRLHFMDAAWPYLLAIAVAAALGTAAYFMREVSIAVDETFVIYSDGRLLAHSTRRLKPGMDDQILSGMFVAIQDFIKDSFKDETSFRLRKLDFGEKSVLVEKGANLYLAVVLHGKASKKVARRMKTVLDDIEMAFSEHLTDWDGDLDKVRGVNDRVKRLYSKAPALDVFRDRKGA